MDRWNKYRKIDRDSLIIVSREMAHKVAEYVLLEVDLEDDTKSCLLDCLQKSYFSNKKLFLKHLREYEENEKKQP